MKANAAIYFHEEGYRTDQPKLMGRHAAGEGFLKGFLAYAEVDELVAYADNEAQFQLFGKLCAAIGGRNAGLPKRWAGPGREEALAGAGTLMLPGPGLAEYGWRRRRGDPRSHALCGVTHTTASHRVMDGLGELLTGPVEPWDAVICTSRAVLATIEHVLASYASGCRSGSGGAVHAAAAAGDPARRRLRRLWRPPSASATPCAVAGAKSWGSARRTWWPCSWGGCPGTPRPIPCRLYAGLEQAARRHGLAGTAASDRGRLARQRLDPRRLPRGAEGRGAVGALP